ncbi:MAG TPA: hypothetical protein VH325_03255 [Bryobacteraceae bacterium]|jgi:hypothetical protein|nr:hypothetical protein [Bryobacteraceae bacterium]
MNTFRSVCVQAIAAVVIAGASANAATYYYTDLTTETLATATTPGSVSGTLTTPSGTITVSYSGDVTTATEVNNTGINYYAGFASVYQNSTVSNMPTRTDLIALNEGYTATPNVLTFSSPITNPILDIVSLGSPGAKVGYNFDAAPIILSQGAAYWGGCSTCLSVTGDTLNGTEGSGVVEFVGTFSSLSWTTTGGEYWNGFDIGIAGLASPVSGAPEPSTVGLVALASLLVLVVMRGRKRVSDR